MSLLELKDVRMGFGGNLVLRSVSFSVSQARTTALLGLNGAGKSVTAACISGLLQPWSGEIIFRGQSILGGLPEQRVRGGIAHIPQGAALFDSLTVEQNLRVGGYPLGSRANREMLVEIYRRFPDLHVLRAREARTLSGGERSQVALARALMSRPSLVVADEPTAGLSPKTRALVATEISRLNREGTAVLLIEQNLGFALEVAHDFVVLRAGGVSLSASRADIADPADLLRHLGLTVDRGPSIES